MCAVPVPNNPNQTKTVNWNYIPTILKYNGTAEILCDRELSFENKDIIQIVRFSHWILLLTNKGTITRVLVLDEEVSNTEYDYISTNNIIDSLTNVAVICHAYGRLAFLGQNGKLRVINQKSQLIGIELDEFIIKVVWASNIDTYFLTSKGNVILSKSPTMHTIIEFTNIIDIIYNSKLLLLRHNGEVRILICNSGISFFNSET